MSLDYNAFWGEGQEDKKGDFISKNKFNFIKNIDQALSELKTMHDANKITESEYPVLQDMDKSRANDLDYVYTVYLNFAEQVRHNPDLVVANKLIKEKTMFLSPDEILIAEQRSFIWDVDTTLVELNDMIAKEEYNEVYDKYLDDSDHPGFPDVEGYGEADFGAMFEVYANFVRDIDNRSFEYEVLDDMLAEKGLYQKVSFNSSFNLRERSESALNCYRNDLSDLDKKKLDVVIAHWTNCADLKYEKNFELEQNIDFDHEQELNVIWLRSERHPPHVINRIFNEAVKEIQEIKTDSADIAKLKQEIKDIQKIEKINKNKKNSIER